MSRTRERKTVATKVGLVVWSFPRGATSLGSVFPPPAVSVCVVESKSRTSSTGQWAVSFSGQLVAWLVAGGATVTLSVTWLPVNVASGSTTAPASLTFWKEGGCVSELSWIPARAPVKGSPLRRRTTTWRKSAIQAPSGPKAAASATASPLSAARW